MTNKELGELWNQKRFDGTWRELLNPQELKRLKEVKNIGRRQKDQWTLWPLF